MAAPSGMVAVLEAEFRQLAAEARSKEGLAGFFGGAGDQQGVKDSAERVILKVRGYADHPDALEQVKAHYQVGAGWQQRAAVQRHGPGTGGLAAAHGGLPAAAHGCSPTAARGYSFAAAHGRSSAAAPMLR